MLKTAVLVSKRGTLVGPIRRSVSVSLVLADRVCPAIRNARRQGLRGEIVLRDDFTPAFDSARAEYTLRLLGVLDLYKIQLVVMAGFMTVLSPQFFEAYKDRVLNIHPALLPEFKGKDAVTQTLAAGGHWTGSTVHLATAEVDSGRILAQSRVPIFPKDTVARLHSRIKKVERRLYPRVIKRYSAELEKTLQSASR